MPKEGSHYDLPIALGVMAAIGAIPHDALEGYRGHRRTGARRNDQRGRGRPAGGDRRQRRGQGPHLSGALRTRGGLGLGRSRHSGAALADPARQPFQGDAGALAPGARVAGGGRPSAGPPRHQGPGERQEGARSGGGGRPQSSHERRAGRGQIDARPAAALDPAAADPARTARSLDDPLDRRDSRGRRIDRPAPVPRAPSLGLHAGPRRGRRSRQARRDFARPQRRPLSRRIAGVPGPGSRQPPPADRDRRGRDRARQPPRGLSRALPAGGGDESLPLRLRPTSPALPAAARPTSAASHNISAASRARSSTGSTSWSRSPRSLRPI